MNRRKFLIRSAVSAAGALVPLLGAGEESGPVKWERSGRAQESLSDELFDAWVQSVLKSVATGFGVPYKRLTEEYSELASTYSSLRGMMEENFPDSEKSELTFKKGTSQTLSAYGARARGFCPVS